MISRWAETCVQPRRYLRLLCLTCSWYVNVLLRVPSFFSLPRNRFAHWLIKMLTRNKSRDRKQLPKTRVGRTKKINNRHRNFFFPMKFEEAVFKIARQRTSWQVSRKTVRLPRHTTPVEKELGSDEKSMRRTSSYPLVRSELQVQRFCRLVLRWATRNSIWRCSYRRQNVTAVQSSTALRTATSETTPKEYYSKNGEANVWKYTTVF